MNVTIVDIDARRYRCSLGLFTELPTEIPDGPRRWCPPWLVRQARRHRHRRCRLVLASRR